MKRLFMGSDHAGLKLKEQIKKHLSSIKQLTIIDVGTNNSNSCHYPDYPQMISEQIAPIDRAIVVCGSGIGIGISMVKCGISCATIHNQYMAQQCSKTTQAIAIGQRVITQQIALKMVDTFLKPWLNK